MEAQQKLTRPSDVLNLLFRKFASHRLKLKDLRKQVDSKKKAKALRPQLEQLEAQVKMILELKKSYSFGESAKAPALANAFIEALEKFEFNFQKLKDNAQKLGL